jgi:hypothetical protein
MWLLVALRATKRTVMSFGTPDPMKMESARVILGGIPRGELTDDSPCDVSTACRDRFGAQNWPPGAVRRRSAPPRRLPRPIGRSGRRRRSGLQGTVMPPGGAQPQARPRARLLLPVGFSEQARFQPVVGWRGSIAGEATIPSQLSTYGWMVVSWFPIGAGRWLSGTDRGYENPGQERCDRSAGDCRRAALHFPCAHRVEVGLASSALNAGVDRNRASPYGVQRTGAGRPALTAGCRLWPSL